MNPGQDALAAVLDVIAEAVAAKVVAQLQAGAAPGMVDQVSSPLGRRRHIGAVRRLVATGAPGAAIVGRRFLLSQDRVQSELEGLGAKPTATPALALVRKVLGQ